jgi:excisionase family DNA binding protein
VEWPGRRTTPISQCRAAAPPKEPTATPVLSAGAGTKTLLHLLHLASDNGRMSIAVNGAAAESAERVAQHALERVRHAAEVTPGQNVFALSIVGEKTPVEIPAEISDVVMAALVNLAAGHHVSVLPRDAELTTVQAAEVLNVSRPYLIKLLDEGKIAYRMVGTHRRVNTGSLVEFKTRDDARAHGAADALVQLSQEMGFDQ